MSDNVFCCILVQKSKVVSISTCEGIAAIVGCIFRKIVMLTLVKFRRTSAVNVNDFPLLAMDVFVSKYTGFEMTDVLVKNIS